MPDELEGPEDPGGSGADESGSQSGSASHSGSPGKEGDAGEPPSQMPQSIPNEPSQFVEYMALNASSMAVASALYAPLTPEERAEATWLAAYEAVLRAVTRVADGTNAPEDLAKVAKALGDLPTPHSALMVRPTWDPDEAARDDRDDDDDDDGSSV